MVGGIIIVDDLGDALELETQLTQADELSSIGLLAAGVAHEVDTPLAVISSLGGNVSQTGCGAPCAWRPCSTGSGGKTFRASEMCEQLVLGIFTGAKNQSAGRSPELDLNHVIEETLKLLEHQFRVSQLLFKTSLDGNLPTILGNSGKLQQVFLFNLF